MLTDVTDALAFIRLGFADLADVGRDLADELLVVPAYDDARGLRHLEGHALRSLESHRVREPDRQIDRVRARRLGSITHADDLELLRETVGNADHHVRDQRPLQPVQRAVRPRVVGAGHVQDVAVARDRDVADQTVLELTLRSLHPYGRTVDRHLDAARDRDRLLSGTRHDAAPVPDLAQDLAADAALARLAVGQETLIRRQDR